jgi:hypothetical protein
MKILGFNFYGKEREGQAEQVKKVQPVPETDHKKLIEQRNRLLGIIPGAIFSCEYGTHGPGPDESDEGID